MTTPTPPSTPTVPPVHLVVGASGTIGTAVAERLHAGGATVALAGRDAERLGALSAGLPGSSVHLVDARDLAAVDALIDAVTARHGRLDGVASFVGSLLLKPAHLTSTEEWTDVIATNLTSAFAVVRSATRVLRNGGGSIVLTSSAAATVGLANHEAVAAAKAGIEGLVRSAAATYGGAGVRINAVAPGLVESRMTARIVASPAAAEASRAMHVLGRLGTAEDVAGAVGWLLDPATRWVTGQVIGVDGGLAHVRPRERG